MAGEPLSDPEGSGGANDPSSQTQAALDNKHNMEQREQYYATVRKPGQQSPCREVSALERIPEYSEDIYPYATFNLPEQENLSANPMRQAFFYERSETMLQGAQVRSRVLAFCLFPLNDEYRGFEKVTNISQVSPALNHHWFSSRLHSRGRKFLQAEFARRTLNRKLIGYRSLDAIRY